MKNIKLNLKTKKINITKTNDENVILYPYLENKDRDFTYTPCMTSSKVILNKNKKNIKNINIDISFSELQKNELDISQNKYIFEELFKSLFCENEKLETMYAIQDTKQDNIISDKIIQMKKMKSLLQKKLYSYHQQDKKQNRHTLDFKITFNELLYLLKESNLQCYYCNDNVYILFQENRHPKQWTLDRIENHLEHTMNNCVISCLECNLQKRRRNHIRFKESKNIKISFID